MKHKIIICILSAMVFSFFQVSSLSSGGDNGQLVLEKYLDSLQNGDYNTAYSYLTKESKQNVPYELFERYNNLKSSIRDDLYNKISFKDYEETKASKEKNTRSIFTVVFSVKENMAYSLPYISSANCALALEEGEWRIIYGQKSQAMEEELERYGFDQYADYGNDLNTFIGSLDKDIISCMKKYGIDGCAVSLIENNEIVFSKSYGYSNVKAKTPINKDTVFDIGSTTKTVAAWGVLKLSESGLIDLDSPAQKYMKRWSFPPSEYDSGKITVRQLIEHRSGLGMEEKRGYGGYRLGVDVVPDLVQSLRGDYYPQYAARQEFAPGEKFEYSNINYAVLQLIIEDITGITFEEYMQKEVFAPLGMRNSTFNIDKALSRSLATGYSNMRKSLPLIIASEQAAGGLYCTAQDLAAFVIAMNKSISPEHGKHFLNYQTVKPIADVETMDYKLGSYVFNSKKAPLLIEHQGHSPGYMALYGALPESGSGIVFLTNSDNGKSVMQPMADKWLRWKVGPSKIVFSSLKYTLQSSRDRAEFFYIALVFIPAVILFIIDICFLYSILKKRRTLTSLYQLSYSKLNLVLCLLSPILAFVWWSVVYDRLFDKISPFPETSFIDFSVAFLVTMVCTTIIFNLLFPRVKITSQ